MKTFKKYDYIIFIYSYSMFHKSKTEAERQRLFDEYMLSILKEKQVIKKNKKSLKKTILVMTQP